MKTQIIKTERRNLLKWLVFGGGAFLVGRVLSFWPGSLAEKTASPINLKNFKLVETNKKLTLYNRGGEEIIIVEKDGF